MGTNGFNAPEVAFASSPYNWKCDIFSTGRSIQWAATAKFTKGGKRLKRDPTINLLTWSCADSIDAVTDADWNLDQPHCQ